jgi:uncharacterized membrane-anchored protein
MRKSIIVICSAIIFVGEVLLLIIFLSAIRSFLSPSENIVSTIIFYLLIAVAAGVAIMFLRREIILAKRDWLNPQDFWFLRKQRNTRTENTV